MVTILSLEATSQQTEVINLRHWPNIEPTMGQSLVFIGLILYIIIIIIYYNYKVGPTLMRTYCITKF